MTFYKNLLIGFILISFTQAVQPAQQSSSATTTKTATTMQHDLPELFLVIPKTVYKLYQEANICQKRGQFKDAYTLFRKILSTLSAIKNPPKEQLKELNIIISRSLCAIGSLYATGKGLEQDPKKAFIYFEKAVSVDPSYTQAVQNLSTCYTQGFGTPKDPIRAAIISMPTAHLSLLANTSTCAPTTSSQTYTPASVAKSLIETLSVLPGNLLETLESSNKIPKGTFIQNKKSLSAEESALVINYFLTLCCSGKLPQLHNDRIFQLCIAIAQAFPQNKEFNDVISKLLATQLKSLHINERC